MNAAKATLAVLSDLEYVLVFLNLDNGRLEVLGVQRPGAAKKAALY
ncbi:hypothetical protein MRBBS_0367 [Marinobacter sp. BSs20148]|nr:hypothetical protein MRBBS_0367 [Marinobacter sp. BSs20148]